MIKYLYPLLFGLFPVLATYEHNQALTDIGFLWRPLALSGMAALLFLVISFFIYKNRNKAAIVSSVFFILLASFGHVLNIAITSTPTPRDYWLLSIVWLIIFIIILVAISRSPKPLNQLNSFFNIFAIALVLMSVFNIVNYDRQKISTSFEQVDIVGGYSDLPDIYYIIFDGYGRQDILSEIYDHDNSYFLNGLTASGFYVATSSLANYPQTYLSVGSALNMDYIDNLLPSIDKSSDDRGPLRSLLGKNLVQAELKKAGYTMVTLPATWTGTYNNQMADVVFNNELSANDFVDILLSTYLGQRNDLDDDRQRLRYIFDKVPEIADIKGPTFSYIHLLSPHPPFIFDADGNDVNPEGQVLGLDGDQYLALNPGADIYRSRYRNQLVFLNTKIEQMIASILDKSDSQPIIILQSDHGPGSMLYLDDMAKSNLRERMSILNAYYVPEELKQLLYPSISPVNSFRLILNNVLETEFAPLDDRSYFATWSQPYNFTEISDQLD